MASQSTIPTKFFVISHTHNFDFDGSTKTSHPFQLHTPRSDILLPCDDLKHCGGVFSFKKTLKMLRSIDAELKLNSAGNQDLGLDKQYWEAQTDYEEI